MSVSADLQLDLATKLGLAGSLRVAGLPIVTRREKELANEIAAASARNAGLCVYVMPTLPTSAQDDVPFVFFDQGETRIRFIEQPAKNATGVDVYQLAEDAANALQWHRSPLLAHPLQLAPAVSEFVADDRWRILDLIFTATYALPARSPAVPVWVADEEHPMEGGLSGHLRAAVIEQLTAGLENPVPIVAKPDHSLGERIGASGYPISIQVDRPRPTRALQGVPFTFFEGFEVRVKITEQPALNSGPDAYDLVEDVATTLHWQPFAGLLAHPLQLARRPTTIVGDPVRREIEVIFNATCGFEPEG